ncbi:3'-5' exonuclease [Salmonella enterica]|uniref:3'-5' exonuclease n=1 Tax=Salmonella enterica TaxID=28901 RepID=UPI003919E46D
MNALGEKIFETRLKPTVSIDPAAAAVHGISDDELLRAPSWPDIAPQLQHHIGRRPLVIFNADFDTRILLPDRDGSAITVNFIQSRKLMPE